MPGSAGGSLSLQLPSVSAQVLPLNLAEPAKCTRQSALEHSPGPPPFHSVPFTALPCPLSPVRAPVLWTGRVPGRLPGTCCPTGQAPGSSSSPCSLPGHCVPRPTAQGRPARASSPAHCTSSPSSQLVAATLASAWTTEVTSLLPHRPQRAQAPPHERCPQQQAPWPPSRPQ